MSKPMKLMNPDNIQIKIREVKSELEFYQDNYNILQEYYNHILRDINVTMNSVRDNRIMYDEVERQKLEYEEESEKQFNFINNCMSNLNMQLIYWQHRLSVLSIKQLYGRNYMYTINSTDENLPVYVFYNSMEIENFLFHVEQCKYEMRKLTLDISETK